MGTLGVSRGHETLPQKPTRGKSEVCGYTDGSSPYPHIKD
tara:strand:+ start:10196 stop:10315 length:120 start_codon:yes stop_codon:yes gene_type:complete